LLERIHPNAEQELERAEILVETRSGGLGEQELVSALRDVPGDEPILLGIRSKTRVTATVIAAVPRLCAVGAFCIGTDQIDARAARRAGVPVFNAPFSSTRSVAELVVGEVVMLSRQVFERSTAAHKGIWDKGTAGSREIRGKVLGIVGYGHIGTQVSILAEALGMQVRYYDLVNKLPLGNAQPMASLHELLSTCDFVSLHVPDTPLTRNMMGHAQLRVMKHGACLLNASRGHVVDIDALREAVREGWLAGAAIDVFPEEPPSPTHPFVCALQGLPNVILTPHVGGSTEEAQANIGIEVAVALHRFLVLGRTLGCVNLPELDAPISQGTACRIVNVHDNVPGVLSSVNRTIAEHGVNIVGQHLGTVDDVGLLFVDVPLDRSAHEVTQLCRAIAALPTNIRTRVA